MKAQILSFAIESLDALVEDIKQDGVIITGSNRAWIIESACRLLQELKELETRNQSREKL